MDTDDTRISFDSDTYKSSAPAFSVPDETPKMVQWVIKISGGAIKDQRQAEYVLLGFVLVAIAVSLFLFFGGSENGAKPLPYEATYQVSR